ncbi:hypothetical protein OM076_09180 [Solirubrobacter ginsenosidimutans]|uniref:Uncharacterized protein n=1 Tax=Solirubrobacter ginsenosidimutans TaxID=490573 RepID=A0A9X3MQ92_9ACTN|nr:hypothetical protein [Solirubrobacter ginsenosidimutans]MDA0160437.1 hypothetical protein [Solirubrobacter ginsenosidimutans]
MFAFAGLAIGVAAAAALLGAEANGSAPPVQPPAALDPANFVRQVTNPWFPLRPGTTLRYRGETDGTPGHDVFSVTHRTKTIQGVRATVVHDRVILHGRTVEDTLDYYAQDKDGNVWYLGEDTKELDRRGNVKSREGTWRAGVDGAEAGIFMPADPRVGQTFRQENYKGHAEDHFKIVSLHASVKVPAVSSHQAMRTREWTPLEPGVRDAKYYVRGKGTVLEETVTGGDERWELVSISNR